MTDALSERILVCLAWPYSNGSLHVGHLAGAAGIAGLIKTVLALQHKKIPPHLHLKERNPYIRWSACPIVIPTECITWPVEETPRVAGVNSFGWSGTNAHILLEEGPSTNATPSSGRNATLLLLSAKTASALEHTTDNLLAHLKQNPDQRLTDVAYTYQVGRNVYADHVGRRKPEVALPEDAREIRGPEIPPDREFQKKQEALLLRRALASLAGEKREVLIMSRFLDLKYEEIAAVMKCEVGTVKVRVYRALRELSDRFFELSGERAS